MHPINRLATKLPPEQGSLSKSPQADIMGVHELGEKKRMCLYSSASSNWKFSFSWINEELANHTFPSVEICPFLQTPQSSHLLEGTHRCSKLLESSVAQKGQNSCSAQTVSRRGGLTPEGWCMVPWCRHPYSEHPGKSRQAFTSGLCVLTELSCSQPQFPYLENRTHSFSVEFSGLSWSIIGTI